MKKVIHFSLANTKGGITQYVLNNWQHIEKAKFQFDMVTFGEKLDFQESLEAEGCKIFYVKNRAEDNLEEFQNDILRIFSEGYDVVHLHTSYWKSFELEKLARQAGIPRVIVHSHNTAVFDDVGREEKERMHYALREKLTRDIATDFCACSQTAAQWLYAGKIPENKIILMKNGVDVDRFAYDKQIRKEYRRKLGWEEMFIIGHVGRFSYQKNHEFLVDVFRRIACLNENVRLLLIGKGPLEARIYSMVNEYGLSNKVCFAGACEDVNRWLQAMDLFCLPSRFEGFPIVAVEAQAAGVPLMLSDAITKEVKLSQDVCYAPLSIDDWVSEVKTKMGDYVLKDIFRRSEGKEIVKRQGYDIKNSVKKLERLYDGR